MDGFLTAAVQRAADTSTYCPRVIVTTGNDRDVTAAPRAQNLVNNLNSVTAFFISRFADSVRPATLVKMLEEHAADAILVVDSSGTLLRLRSGSEFKLHGGLGVLRVRNVLGGGNDVLTSEACALREGDVFVDGTAGQLQDALVAAAAVGPSGKVIAIEASPLLWAVTSGRPCRTGDDDVDALLNERIEVRQGEASTVLAAMPSNSADVVYFDPMWVAPSKSSSSFDVLRTLAHTDRLRVEAIVEAKRVARRAVVVMDQIGGCELERLGLPVVQTGQRKRYGVLSCEEQPPSSSPAQPPSSPAQQPVEGGSAADALAAHADCFADLQIATAYELSANEATRRGLDRRTDDSDLTYGDVPFNAIAKALELASPSERGCTFVDLGSGVSRGVIAAALLWPFESCIGIEILEDLHTAALEPARRFDALRANAGPNARIAKRVELRCADLFDVDLSSLAALGDGSELLIFICCVTWPAALMTKCAAKLARELPNGARIVTVGQRLPNAVELQAKDGKDAAVSFEEVGRFSYPFEWGAEVVVCCKAVRLGVLAARRLKKGR